MSGNFQSWGRGRGGGNNTSNRGGLPVENTASVSIILFFINFSLDKYVCYLVFHITIYNKKIYINFYFFYFKTFRLIK